MAPLIAYIMAPLITPLIAPLIAYNMAPLMAPLMEPQKSKLVAANHNIIMMLLDSARLKHFGGKKLLAGEKKNTTHNLYVVSLAGKNSWRE